jgi:hypothetical protein
MSPGVNRSASLFELWSTIASVAGRSSDAASEVAAAIARVTSDISTVESWQRCGLASGG